MVSSKHPLVDPVQVQEVWESFEGTVSEIAFHRKPDLQLLDLISDVPSKKLCFFSFDLGFVLGDVDNIAEHDWSHQIKAASLKSDAFSEQSHLWHEFSNAEALMITARLSDVDRFFDERDLANFWHGVSEGMRNLKCLSIRLDCGPEAFDAAKLQLNWPAHDLKLKIERGTTSRTRGWRTAGR